jgi:hypothetical protein
MLSIAIAFASSFCAVASPVVAIAGDQVHDEIGRCAAQRDSSDDRQKRKPNAAVGSAAEDEADAAGNSQRSQRFLAYVFADVPIAPAYSLIDIL